MKKQIFAALAALALTFAAQHGASASDAAPVTVDNYGRKVTVTETPQRVLTLGSNCTELFIALGLGDKIIGNTLDNHSRGPLPEYAAEYARVPELNYGSATREAALTSGADFVFGVGWEFGGGGLDVAELEEKFSQPKAPEPDPELPLELPEEASEPVLSDEPTPSVAPQRTLPADQPLEEPAVSRAAAVADATVDTALWEKEIDDLCRLCEEAIYAAPARASGFF